MDSLPEDEVHLDMATEVDIMKEVGVEISHKIDHGTLIQKWKIEIGMDGTVKKIFTSQIIQTENMTETSGGDQTTGKGLMTEQIMIIMNIVR